MLAGMCRRILCNGNESVLSVVSTTLAADSTGNSNLSSASHRHHSYDKSLPTQIQSRHQLPMRMGNGRRVFYFGIPGFGCGFFFVVSGFLMTSIVGMGLERGIFSLCGFYVARVRRIVSALAVLCVVLIGLCWA